MTVQTASAVSQQAAQVSARLAGGVATERPPPLPRPQFSGKPEDLRIFMALLEAFLRRYFSDAPQVTKLEQCNFCLPVEHLRWMMLQKPETVDEWVAALQRHCVSHSRREELVLAMVPHGKEVNLLTGFVRDFMEAYEEYDVQLPLQFVKDLLLVNLSNSLRATVRERTSAATSVAEFFNLLQLLSGLSAPSQSGDVHMNALTTTHTTRNKTAPCVAYMEGKCSRKACPGYHPFRKGYCLVCGAAGFTRPAGCVVCGPKNK
jgi:hypothetical protein